MNNLMLVALAVVLLCYCGGKYCPKVLSSNKEVVLGVLVGMALCSFAGLRMEGFKNLGKDCILNNECNSKTCEDGECVDPKSLSQDIKDGRGWCLGGMKSQCGGPNRDIFNDLCGRHGFQCP
jgi:hypothetical protein